MADSNTTNSNPANNSQKQTRKKKNKSKGVLETRARPNAKNEKGCC